MPKLMLTKETVARLQTGPALQRVQGGSDTLVSTHGMIGWCFGETAHGNRCLPPPPPPTTACVPDTMACGGYTDWCVGV